ncbi:MAG: hypothetical protein E7046_03035 [Lentisphaerae bacterium]|nr:hypothetical protein [Lentisphaerota bacterium]
MKERWTKEMTRSAVVVFAACVAVAGVARDGTALPLLPYPHQVSLSSGVFKSMSLKHLLNDVRSVVDGALPHEGYCLSVTETGVRVCHADASGLFYAHQTLIQLANGGNLEPIEIPCVEITDYPAWGHRGVMLDDARHFLGKETVKKTIDLISRYKMNVFHWHLTDDEGWRLELKRHPEVHTKGSVRPASMNHGSTEENMSWNGERYGPYFYTQEDVKEIVAYAAARHVTVIPEIDFPAHSRAVFVSHPEFTCEPEDSSLKVPWMKIGPQYQCYCAANEAGMAFMEDVLDEVCDLFPSEKIHIGGDECPLDNWLKCSKCRELMSKLGISDARDLQGRITKRLCAFLAKRGRRAVAWDETLSEKLPPNMTLQLWREPEYGRRAASLGVEVIMSPRDWTYFSRPQGIADDPYQYLGPTAITLPKAYSFSPCDGWSNEERQCMKGIECCCWGEMIWNWYDLGWKLWPRAFATAEVAWSGPNARSVNDFFVRARVHRMKILKEFVNPAPVPENVCEVSR